MTGLHSRNKGKRGERELAKYLSDLLGIDCRRGVQYQGGPESPDVVGVPGWHLEVKVRKQRPTWGEVVNWYEQARIEAPAGSDPCVLYRWDRSQWWLAWAAGLPRIGRLTWGVLATTTGDDRIKTVLLRGMR